MGDATRGDGLWQLRHPLAPAAGLAGEASTLATEQQERLRLVDGLRVQGMMLARQEQGEEASRVLDDGLELARSLPSPYAEGRILYRLGLFAQEQGEHQQARQHPDEALGRGRGGFTTTIHLRAEGRGQPLTFLITAGQRHEQPAFEALMETGAVRRAGRGRPRIRPDRVAGDKGYSSKKIRRYLRRRGIGAVIPRQKRERRIRFDRTAYHQRHLVERLVNRLKGFRRIATGYEKRAVHYLGMLTVAAIVLWL